MNRPDSIINKLFSIRNKYGKEFDSEKFHLLNKVDVKALKSKEVLQTYYSILLFLIAYPDNKTIHQLASRSLKQLQLYIESSETIKYRLYNSGITGTNICAAFSFEIVKWLRKTSPNDIAINSFEAADGQIQSILSAVMPKVESEIMQDANAEWKSWLGSAMKKNETMLDRFIGIFDSSDLRPEIEDELWNAIGINVEINFPLHCALPGRLVTPYYHRSLIGSRQVNKKKSETKPNEIKLTETEAEQIIDCGRKILARKLREIDPISFTSAKLVSYYQLERGISIALMGMVPERRHPIDSYMGYLVFKNGLPVGYAGSWILFNSARIGLNVFGEYRGGEAQYIFQQVLNLHSQVYHLKRFSVDPYQLGKENSDGIHSGAFWVYQHAGFIPLNKEQKEIAAREVLKKKSDPRYRSPEFILKKLAGSRMELVLNKSAVQFDAGDLSLAYAAILEKKYGNDRMLAEKQSIKKLADILQVKNYQEAKMKFILKNWCLLLLNNEKELRRNSILKRSLKKLFVLKATGSEEEYIKELQRSVELRKFLETLLKQYSV